MSWFLTDYPLCLLPDKMYKLLKRTLKECTPQMQALFYEHCIQNILADIGKGFNEIVLKLHKCI
jgi:hypothetical protein